MKRQIFLANDVAKDVISKISFVVSQENVVVFRFGVKALEGNKIMNLLSCGGGSEKVEMSFITEAPVDYDPSSKGYMQVAFLSKLFVGLVKPIIGFNERIYIECDTEAGCFVGITSPENSVRLPIGNVSKDKIPATIAIAQDKRIVTACLNTKAITATILKGASMTGSTVSDERGIGNAVVAFDYADDSEEANSRKGKVSIYSTDGAKMGTCSCDCIFDNREATRTVEAPNKESYFKSLETKKISKLAFGVPKKYLESAVRLFSDAPTINWVFTDKAVYCVDAKNTCTYTFSLAANLCSSVFNINNWINAEKQDILIVDAESFRDKIDILQKAATVTATGGNALIMDISSGSTLHLSCGNATATVKVIASTLKTEGRIGLNPKLLLEVIGTLDGGNLRVSVLNLENTVFSRIPVEFANGDLKGLASGTGVAYISPINIEASPKPEKTEEADTADNNAVSEE